MPATSNRFGPAQMALTRMLIAGTSEDRADDLAAASVALKSVEGIVEGLEANRLRAALFSAAALQAARKIAAKSDILGVQWKEDRLRLAAEKELRACARIVNTDLE